MNDILLQKISAEIESKYNCKVTGIQLLSKESNLNMLQQESDLITESTNEQVLDIPSEKLVLDVCCGSKMFWFQKNIRMFFLSTKEERSFTPKIKIIRTITVEPDLIADFTNLPFKNNTFNLVVFDPPHLKKLGETSWLAKKYGKLPSNWQGVISKGFYECMRVLKPGGTLIFKWGEHEIKASEILSLIPYTPLFGHTTGRQSKTIWMCFIKLPSNPLT